MQIRSGKIPKERQLARLGSELSRAGVLRLQWMTHDLQHGRNAAFTCRHFGISRESFYRWWRRYDPHNLSILESRWHRPHRRRQPTWPAELAEAVLRLRSQFPRWGKDKLAVLLRREGRAVSTSMVGRILSHLKRRGMLVEPLPVRRKARRSRPARPYAVRKPRDYQPQAPGDLVPVDTLELRPVPGVIVKQCTARDVISRWDVLEAHSRATASLAAQFLDTPEAADALPHPGHPGRWRQRVRRRLRASLPTARPAPVCLAAPFS